MVPREVRITLVEHDAVTAMLVSVYGRPYFRAVVHADDEGAHRVRAVVKSDCVA